MLHRGAQRLEGAPSPMALPHSQVAPGGRDRRLTIPWVGGAALLVSFIALVPLGFVASATLEAGWAEIAALVWRPRVGELLINTALLVMIATPLCVVLGVGLAVLTERTDLPGHRVWSMIRAAPLAIPAFVHSYAWVSVAPWLHGLFAGVLVSTLAYFPFLYLPVAAALRGLDPALEDVAASLGLTPCRVFFRVVLPQLRLAIWGGGLLIALHLLSEYGLFAMVRFDTFTTAIFDQFQSTFNGPAANMLAGILALALVTIAVRFARPLYQTVIAVLRAYVMIFLPRALISLRAGVPQAPAELEEVARSLGHSPARALWRITLPLAAPSAAAGAAMVFLGIVNELTATLLLAPNGTETLATSFWALSGEIDYAAAAPYATIMIALSLPLTWLLYRQSQRLAGR
jgi:ABC-type Fe3+ transport system permease subunit